MDRGGGWVWDELREEAENSLNEYSLNKMLKELAIFLKKWGKKKQGT